MASVHVELVMVLKHSSDAASSPLNKSMQISKNFISSVYGLLTPNITPEIQRT
jgi:hypothetical protein